MKVGKLDLQEMHLRLHFLFAMLGQICSKQPFPHPEAASGKRSPSAESLLVLTPHMLLNHSFIGVGGKSSAKKAGGKWIS